MDETRESFESIIEEWQAERLIIGGDFNTRIEKERISRRRGRKRKKRSKDKIKNTEGEKMIEMIEEKGWEILNENMEGNEEGEFIYI